MGVAVKAAVEAAAAVDATVNVVGIVIADDFELPNYSKHIDRQRPIDLFPNQKISAILVSRKRGNKL